MMNKGVVYALWDYEAQNSDELSFHEGDALTILRRKDESETEWWWARLGDREGYVPKNLLGVSTQVTYWETCCPCLYSMRSCHAVGLGREACAFSEPQQPPLYRGRCLLGSVGMRLRQGPRRFPWPCSRRGGRVPQ